MLLLSLKITSNGHFLFPFSSKKKEEKEKDVENEEEKVLCRTPLAKNILR
jgi:hypothetical protein